MHAHIISADPEGRRASTVPSWSWASRLPCFHAASRLDVHLKQKQSTRKILLFYFESLGDLGMRQNAAETRYAMQARCIITGGLNFSQHIMYMIFPGNKKIPCYKCKII